MSEKSTKNAANNMVDLIRELIQQELIKEDNTATCRIMACNSDGSYDINVLPDMVTVIRSVKSISPENLKQGDYAYIFKFKNKLNNAVIIAKIGGVGSDVRFLTARDESGNVVNVSGGPFLPLTGGTLTGSLDVTPDSTSSHKHVKVNAPSGSAYAELSTFAGSSTTRARLTLNDGSGSPTEYRTQEIKIGNYTLSFPVLSANKTIATTDYVSGVNDGTNWTSITINGVTKSIPTGGSADTDTWRGIQINGSPFLSEAITSGDVNFKAGSNITLTSGNNNDITIEATNSYHTAGSWNDTLTYTFNRVGNAPAISITIPTGTAANTVALGNHNHDDVYLKKAGGQSNGMTGILYAPYGIKLYDSAEAPVLIENDGSLQYGADVLATQDWVDDNYLALTDSYIKTVSVNGNTLTITPGTGSAITFTPTFTDKYHTSGSWSGLTYTATANGGAEALEFTIPTGTTSTTVAAGDHTHSEYVPYTNATANVDLNGHELVASDIAARSTSNVLDVAILLPTGFTYSRVAGGSLKVANFNFPDTTGTKTIATQEWVTGQGYVTDNQTVKVGSTTFAAGAEVGFIAGNNVDSIVADTTNNTITINTHDTTYNNATTTTAGLMSAADKLKLNGIAAGAEVNVQSDWNVTDSNSDAFIKNKPSIPTVYLKNASVSGNTLTITKQDNTTVTYNPITEIMTAFDEDVAEAFLDNDYPSFIKLVDDGHGNPRFAFDTTNYSVVSGVNDGTNWTSITINGVTKAIPNDNDNQTIKGNGTAFGANDAVDILGTSNLVTVTANTTNKTITINLADAYGDTKNPYGNKAANLVLASPNGSTGAPQFRALVAADIPDLREIYLPRAGGSSYPMTGTLYVKGSGAAFPNVATSITTNTANAPHIYISGDTSNSGKVFLNSLIIGDPAATGTSIFAREYNSFMQENRVYTLPDITGKFIMDAGAQTITGLKTISNSSGLAFTDSHTTSYIKTYTYGDGSDIPYESGLKLDAQHVILSGNSFMGSDVVAVNNGSLYANGLYVDRGTDCIYFGLDTDSMTNNGFYFAGVSDSNSPRLQPNANGYGLRLPDTSSWSADRTVATTSDIGNGTLTIQGNGTAVSTFTANQSGNTTLNIKGGGITSVTKTANNEITITSTEADTLASVTARGATTSTAITLNGGLTVTGTADVSGGTLKLRTINAPTSSGGTTYGPGSNGQVLKSNGSTVYWATDTNSDTWRAIYVDGAEKLGTRIDSGALNFISQNASDGDVTFTYDTTMAALKAKAKIPTALKNPNAIKIQGGGQDVASYDGSAAKTINIAASSTAGAFTISDGTTTRTIQLAGVFTDNNQRVKAGSVTFGVNDEVNFVAGNNVTITGDATAKTITISGNAGTVTSVGLRNGSTSQGTLTISGSPITSSGIIDITLTDAYGDTKNPYGAKAANKVLAGPTSGNAAAPTFRSLVAADIPNIYVRFDTASQGLNDTQKQNARTNIGAGIPVEIVDLTALA